MSLPIYMSITLQNIEWQRYESCIWKISAICLRVLHKEIESEVEPTMTCQPLLWKQYALAWPLAKSFLAPLRSLYLSCVAFDNHDFAPDNISLSCRPKKDELCDCFGNGYLVTWLIYTTFYFNLLAIWCCASVFCFIGSSSSTLSLCAKIFARPHTLFNVVNNIKWERKTE